MLGALMLSCAVQTQAQYHTLNLWLKNGDIVKFSLDSHVKIVATSPSELAVESAGYSIAYPVEAIRKFTVNNDTVPARIVLSDGWNWMSHNLTEAIPVTKFYNATQILAENTSAYNDPVLGMVGQLKELTSGAGYKVNIPETTIYDFSDISYAVGSPVVNLHQGWNWVGYPLSVATSLSTALSGVQWQEGDCIAAQDAFAVYTDGQWEGSLSLLTPLSCYLVKSAMPKSFSYNVQTEGEALMTIQTQVLSQDSPQPSSQPEKARRPVHSRTYPNTMNIVAQIAADEAMENYTVAAYSGAECRGIGTVVGGRIYLTVHGKGGEPIHFQITDAKGNQMQARQTETFASDLLGTAKAPYTITLDDATSIGQIAVQEMSEPLSIYTTSGSLVKTVQPVANGSIDVLLSDLPRGIYVVKSKSVSCKITKR